MGQVADDLVRTITADQPVDVQAIHLRQTLTQGIGATVWIPVQFFR